MERFMNLSFRKGDLAAVALVVVLAVLVAVVFLPRESTDAAVTVYLDGVQIGAYSLNEDAVIPVSGEYHNTVVIKDGKVAVTESDCPGEDCVHSGWIGTPGRSIVCLPNRLEVRIEGKSDVDFVVG